MVCMEKLMITERLGMHEPRAEGHSVLSLGAQLRLRRSTEAGLTYIARA
jgi:hypothetical protein